MSNRTSKPRDRGILEPTDILPCHVPRLLARSITIRVRDLRLGCPGRDLWPANSSAFVIEILVVRLLNCMDSKGQNISLVRRGPGTLVIRPFSMTWASKDSQTTSTYSSRTIRARAEHTFAILVCILTAALSILLPLLMCST